MTTRKGAEKGVSSGSPAGLFENFSQGEIEAFDDARPFRDRPQPIGGSRKGIPNKRSSQLRELYLRMGLPHPILAQGQLLRLGVDGLAKALDCSLLDAADLWSKIADRIAPYIEGKQPLKVSVDAGEGLPLVVVGDLRAALAGIDQARQDGALAIDDDAERAIEQYQRVKEGQSVRLEEASSHETDKPLK